MIALRFDLFPLAVLLILGLCVVAVMRALFPGRFDGRAARWGLRLAALAVASAVLALELAARTHAPVGGGAWRAPVGAIRSAVVALWVSAAGVTVWHAAVELVGRVRLRLRARASERASATPVAAVADPQSPEETQREVEAPSPEAPVVARRVALDRAVNTALVAGVHAYVGYGFLKGRRDLRVREVVVRIPKLPRALEGYTIVQLTDIHVGIFMGDDEFRPLVERAHSLSPDAMVLTGDLLDRHPRHVPDALRMFSSLRARDGVYAILGNHDYYTGYAPVLRALERAGARALVNEHVVLRPRDQGGITLAGVDDLWAPRTDPSRRMDVPRALAGSDPERARVLLAHNPKSFHAAKGLVDLQLSGHTHGGQINPGSMMNLALEYVSGLYRSNESTLFVCNGLGFTGAPVRLSAPPEIAKIVLVR